MPPPSRSSKDAGHALQAMFERRPELRAVEHLVDIDDGKYDVMMRGLDLQHAEISLSVALRAQEKREKEPGYPVVAVYKADGDDQPTGLRLRWVMYDQDPVATRFATMGDAEAEADSLNFLAQSEEMGVVYVAETYTPEAVPPAPVAASQGGRGQKRRRRGRRKATSRTA